MHFVETRANALQLMAPRYVKVVEPEQKLAELYAQLMAAPTCAHPVTPVEVSANGWPVKLSQ
jgi:hypothetical protein